MTQAVEKVCNRVLFMGDDYRYNESAMGCELPMGHDGPHQHMYEGPPGKPAGSTMGGPVLLSQVLAELQKPDPHGHRRKALDDILKVLSD